MLGARAGPQSPDYGKQLLHSSALAELHLGYWNLRTIIQK